MMPLCSLGCHLIGSRQRVLLSQSWRFSLARSSFSSLSFLQTQLPHDRTRNIGIIAHIDAGKTTTTERMLFYAGKTRRIGNVDEGSTVTDFLPAERARGITIQSAVVTLHWLRQNGLLAPEAGPGPPKTTTTATATKAPDSQFEHRINLIDTPGHVDFNFEVIRSLRILDGAVCILDGVAGVEAQTEAVWSQTSRYQIPRIVFVNKLDRVGASFRNSVLAVASRLSVRPAVCQIPWYDRATGEFCGIVDVVSLRALQWRSTDLTGRSIDALTIPQLAEVNPALAKEVSQARLALVDLLSDYDEALVEEYLDLADSDHMVVSESTILRALRRCTLASPQVVVPILCGASFRNIGVQPLLDSVVDYLPSPTERPDSQASFVSFGTEGTASLKDILVGNYTDDLSSLNPSPVRSKKSTKQKSPGMVPAKVGCCALAFKVVNDPIRGMLVYVRVYHGSLDKNAVLYNTNLAVSEKAVRILEMYANEAIEQTSIPVGQIGVIAGLKHARTGDTLVSYQGLATKAGSPPPPAPLDTLQLKPILVPPPVFFVAIEPASPSEEKNMWDAISILLREDPSLRVTVDSETGQAQMSGLGELHLEIATDRLINDLKAKVTVGPVEIGYRETVLRTGVSTPGHGLAEREVSGMIASVNSEAVISPREDSEDSDDRVPCPLSSLSSNSEPEHVFGPINLTDDNVLYVHLRGSSGSDTPSSNVDPDLDTDTSLDLPLPLQTAISAGVMACLARGPRASYPLHSCRVDTILEYSSLPTDHNASASPAILAALSASARAATSSAIRNLYSPPSAGSHFASLSSSPSHRSPSSEGSGSFTSSSSSLSSAVGFMEPVMKVHITVDESDMGNVIHDLSSARGGHVLALEEGEDSSMDDNTGLTTPHLVNQPVYTPPDLFESSASSATSSTSSAPSRQRVIAAKVPLSEMVGYNRHLRSLTRGRGVFSMQVDRFEKMNALREKRFLASAGKLFPHSRL